jgi:hypothetical protein
VREETSSRFLFFSKSQESKKRSLSCRLNLTAPDEGEGSGHSTEPKRKPGDVIANVPAVERSEASHDFVTGPAERRAAPIGQVFAAESEGGERDRREGGAEAEEEALRRWPGIFRRLDPA